MSESGPEQQPFPWFRLLVTALVLLVFIAFLTATPLVHVALHGLPVRHEVLELHAVEDGSAIVLWREEGEAHWLSRYDAHEEKWRRRVPGHARHITIDSGAIGVGTDFVVLQTTDPARGSFGLVAFELRTGAVRWRVVAGLPSHGEALESAIAERLYVAHERILMATRAGWIRVDPTSGRIIDVDTRERFITSSVIKNGELQSAYDAGERKVWCELRDGTARIEHAHRDGKRRVTLHLDTSAVSRAIPIGDIAIDKCATYGDRVVLLSDVRKRADDSVWSWVRVVNDDGNVVAENFLPGHSSHERTWDLDRDPHSGQLARFHLFATSNVSSEVHLVDLETGRIVRSDRSRNGDHVHIGGRWVYAWQKWRNAKVLRIADDRTGASLDTVTVPLGTQFSWRNAAAGYLWLFDKYADTIQLVRIELATMRVDTNHGGMRVGYSKS